MASNNLKIYSQLYQDAFASFLIGGKFEKTFLEFGATDGLKLSNSYLLEKLVQKIEENDPINVMVVDNLTDIFMEEGMEDIETAEDTMSIVSKYIEALETEVDKEKLDFLMKDLYNESLQTEFNLE